MKIESVGLQMKYFVLKPKGDDAYAAASRAAMFKYATLIESENYELARQLREWAEKEMSESYARGQTK